MSKYSPSAVSPVGLSADTSLGGESPPYSVLLHHHQKAFRNSLPYLPQRQDLVEVSGKIVMIALMQVGGYGSGQVPMCLGKVLYYTRVSACRWLDV